MDLKGIEKAKAAAEQAARQVAARLEQLDQYWSTQVGITELDERATLKVKLQQLEEQAHEIAEAYVAQQKKVDELKASYDEIDGEYRKACDGLDKIARKHADKIAKDLADWQDKVKPLWEDHKRARHEWARASGYNSGSTSEYSPFEMARKVPADIQNAVLFARGE